MAAQPAENASGIPMREPIYLCVDFIDSSLPWGLPLLFGCRAERFKVGTMVFNKLSFGS